MTKKILLTSLALLFVAHSAGAVSLYLVTDNETPTKTAVTVTIDTGATSINTLAGKIFFTPTERECTVQSGASSIINTWINSPASNNGEISFAGIIPGGYTGTGSIATITCNSNNDISESPVVLNPKDFEIYLNDGTGQLANVSIAKNQTLDQQVRQTLNDQIKTDQTAPEILALNIIKPENLSDNNYLLIFNIVDKQSGLTETALATSNRKFNPETDQQKINSLHFINIYSPFVLPITEFQQYHYFKATDAAGNIKLARLDPVISLAFWQTSSFKILIIIILLLVIASLPSLMLKLKRRH